MVHLTVRCEALGACCPSCACWTAAVHSSYERTVADLPMADRQVVVHLQVRRFRCREQTCPRRTFVEQVPSLVQRYARRTRRLRGDLEEIGLALGGRPGSRLSTRQNKPTSRMTLLRLVRALPDPPMHWPAGWANTPARRSSPATATVSTPARRGVVLRMPCKWPTGGTSSII